jgi:predicted CopG family antitoxin
MKTIGPIYLDDEDYEALAKAKGDKSWKDFIMQLAKK